MSKRAERRASLARMKRKALRIYPHDARARSANHLKTCSCVVCGNPRRFGFKDPVPELRASEAFAQALQELAEA